MELSELLEAEGLDADEVLNWARGRADELTADLPADMDLEGLLDDMPDLSAAPVTTRASQTRTPPADSSDEDLLGEDGGEFEALNMGSFDIVEEGSVVNDGGDFDTGPLPAAEEGVPEEELDIMESAELLEVSDEELEELDDEDFVEFQSGEYEIVEDAEPEPSRPPAMPSAEAEPGAPEELEDAGSFDIDLDL